MEELIQHLPYLGLFTILFISGFGVPIPEDIPLVLGGYYCAKGDARIEIMLPVGLISIIGADFLVYLMGRRFGHIVPNLPVIGRYFNEARLARAAEAFHQHGAKIIFFARFLPGLRTPIYFTAGSFKLPAWKMLSMDGAAALLSVPLLMLLPYYYADHIDKVWVWIHQGQMTVLATVVILITGFVGIKYFRYRRRNKIAS